MLAEPQVDFPARYLPTGFEGHIEWTVAVEDDPNFTVPLQIFSTPVEFYCLPSNVPKYISDGLPAQLLRILLQTRFEKYDDSYHGWIKYCMDFLRSQNFRYETLGGKSNYANFLTHGASGPVTNTCHLEHWLDHYEMLRAELNAECQRRVNCYDLAALGQVLLAVGLDPARHKIKMKYLEPYGMINPTRLIGFNGMCNNPFFEDGRYKKKLESKPM
jgi:hypothetical protein